jgi:hypothetical protein
LPCPDIEIGCCHPVGASSSGFLPEDVNQFTNPAENLIRAPGILARPAGKGFSPATSLRRFCAEADINRPKTSVETAENNPEETELISIP